jgi:hypothetical protein
MNYSDADIHDRNLREKKVFQSTSRDSAAGNPDRGQGKVIDIRI